MIEYAKIVIQLLSLGYTIYISSRKEAKSMLIHSFIANLISLLVYILLGELSTSLTVVIMTIRSLIMTQRDRFKTNIIFYILLLVTLAPLLTVKNILDILPVFASLCATFVSWRGDAQLIRIGCSVSDISWTVYNICIGAYIQAVVSAIALVSKIYFIIKYRVKSC